MWVQLFRKAPGYRTTKLVRDVRGNGTYFTLDFWDSRKAYEQFRQDHALEYAAIDVACEA